MSEEIESSEQAKKAIVKGVDYLIELHRKSASTSCALVSQNCKLIELNKEHCDTIKQQAKRIEELTDKLLSCLNKLSASSSVG